MNKKLFHNILATVVYHDEFDYPLTAFEIWKYLIKFPIFFEKQSDFKDDKSQFLKNSSFIAENCYFFDVIMELENPDIKKFIEEYRGFYFLKGRKSLVEKRILKNKISEIKIKKLRKIIYFFRFLPFVRGVAITGRLASKNACLESDWDVFIVLKNGKIWTGRTIVTLFVQFIGKRRYGKKIKDRICLNCFVSDDSLEMNNQDLFSAREYFILRPVFGKKIFQQFRQKNSWIKKYYPNYNCAEKIDNLEMIPETKIARFFQLIGEYLFSWNFLEKLFRKIEKRKIEKNPLSFLEGSFIEANDKRLVFFVASPAERVIRKFEKRMQDFVV